jgi:hypothetical protein
MMFSIKTTTKGHEVTRDELIDEAVSQVLAGLQVPRSLNGAMMLGAACEPYDKLHSFVGFGWLKAEEFAKALRSML